MNEAHVSESHEQLSGAWGLYSRGSRDGEIVDTPGLRLANARQAWFLRNASEILDCQCGARFKVIWPEPPNGPIDGNQEEALAGDPL